MTMTTTQTRLHKAVLAYSRGPKITATDQDHLVDEASVPEAIGRQVVDGVHGHAAARQGQPLHVPAFSAPQSHDAFLREQVQRQRVDPLQYSTEQTVNKPTSQTSLHVKTNKVI